MVLILSMEFKMDIRDLIISKSVGNLYWKDREGKYGGCNNEFAAMIGLASPAEIVGKTDRDLFLNALGEEKLQQLIQHDQVIMREDKEKTLEEVGIDSEKRIAYYITRKAPLKDDQGNVIGLIGTSINITKEKQAMLAKQAFLENMSHDIRTPLAGVYGLSQILHEDYEQVDPKKAKEIVGDIEHASGTLLEFLDHVLQVLALGKDPIKKERMNIKTRVDEVIQMLLPALERSGLQLQVDCPSIFIFADKFRLVRILLNLLSNAIKFTSKGEIKIRVYTAMDLIIEIEDTGIGIPEDQLESIFEQFYKIRPSNQTVTFTGCGLGLYMARIMAREMGGDITVKSVLHQGSKFSVILKYT
jgi:two-component system, OmpR family, aerobic respiration control sensor histidine kinase ArcB